MVVAATVDEAVPAVAPGDLHIEAPQRVIAELICIGFTALTSYFFWVSWSILGYSQGVYDGVLVRLAASV